MEVANTVIDFLEHSQKILGFEVHFQQRQFFEWALIVFLAAGCGSVAWCVGRCIVILYCKLRDWNVERGGGFASPHERTQNQSFPKEFPIQFELSGLTVQEFADLTHIKKSRIKYWLRRPHRIPDQASIRSICLALLLPVDFFRQPCGFHSRNYGPDLTIQRISRYLSDPERYGSAAISLLGRRDGSSHKNNHDIVNCFEEAVLMQRAGRRKPS